MKKTKLTNRRALLLLATALLLFTGCVSANAYDFVAKNGDGKIIAYNIISSSNMTCEVTYLYKDSSSNADAYTDAVAIPETATYLGTTYFVVMIGDSAFTDCSGLTSVTIPKSVLWIDRFAFCKCSGLTQVTIPNSVIAIDAYAFAGCTGLKSMTIPESVKEIGAYSFQSCAGLKSITIPESVIWIGNLAFSGCSGLTEITIPKSVTSIGSLAFLSCSSLTSIYSLNPEPPTIGSGAFIKVNTDTCTLYVPKGSKEAYSKAEEWKDFKKIVEM